MNDFLKGYSQGMTGTTSGQPSQSVLEAMGRDAARNQWNNNNQNAGGGTYAHNKNVVPITKVLYEAGKKMRFKKIMRDLLIGLAISAATFILYMLVTPSGILKWGIDIISVISMLLILWAVLRLPVYLIARIGSLFGGRDKAEE